MAVSRDRRPDAAREGVSGGEARHTDERAIRTRAPALVVSAVGVLALAAWALRYERSRLLDDFAASQQEVARQLAGDLVRELEELDDDARLISSLVSKTKSPAGGADPDQRAFILAGFDALATVVRHYRSIAFFRAGSPVVSAVDPAESDELSAAFGRWSATAARQAAAARRSVIAGPREGPDGRQFFVYARPGGGGEVVIFISEARFLLRPVLRSHSPHLRHFLVDPSRSIWVGCNEPTTCRAFTTGEWAAVPGLAALVARVNDPGGHAWATDSIAAAVGLPARRAALAWHHFERAGHPWAVGVAASSQTLDARERSLVRRLVATSAALILALGGLTVFIGVHQRRSVALRERLRHAQELAHLRDRTEKLLDNVSVGLIGVTDDGRVALANRFFEERGAAVSPGASLTDVLSPGNDAVARRLAESLAAALRTRRPQFLPGEETPVLTSIAGHFDLRLIPLTRPADDVSALVLVEDLSELKSLEQQLVRAEKLVTVGVLTAGLAHEIGTPLGIIRGRAEVLLGKVADPAIARDLGSVIQQIDQIGSTIRQVLDFASGQPVELRAVPAREAVDAAVALLEFRLRQKEIRIRIDAPSDVPAIAADPAQLQQVLVNLLLNAYDACAKGGSITVRLAAGAGTRSVMIQIEDDGCGIPADHLHAIFDPYFTTKKRGEGTGLGLPVAASIVSNHRGEIIVTSEPGRGTTVTLTWPAVGESTGGLA